MNQKVSVGYGNLARHMRNVTYRVFGGYVTFAEHQSRYIRSQRHDAGTPLEATCGRVKNI
jgi:hypothetical protein